MTHTPGPWETTSGGPGPNDHAVCMAGGGDIIAEVYHEHRHPEQAAHNARLIAAAPDLLAALKECLLDLDHYVKRRDRAIAAIAKATSNGAPPGIHPKVERVILGKDLWPADRHRQAKEEDQ